MWFFVVSQSLGSDWNVLLLVVSRHLDVTVSTVPQSVSRLLFCVIIYCKWLSQLCHCLWFTIPGCVTIWMWLSLTMKQSVWCDSKLCHNLLGSDCLNCLWCDIPAWVTIWLWLSWLCCKIWCDVVVSQSRRECLYDSCIIFLLEMDQHSWKKLWVNRKLGMLMWKPLWRYVESCRREEFLNSEKSSTGWGTGVGCPTWH